MSEPQETPPAAVVTGSPAGSFAWSVLHDRHPALIARVRRATPYPPEQQHALDALSAEIAEGGVIKPLYAREPGAEAWRSWGPECVGRPWADVPFLWAESFFYRKLLAALGYFRAGPWQGIDPFAPFKDAELAGPKVDEEIAALDRLPDLAPEEQDAAVLLSSLWGNRADLGFQMSSAARESGEHAPGLVADDTSALWRVLDAARPGTVCVVADNAGPELLPDLVLADHLLRTGRAARVVLHLKPHPYFVSDATPADALACLTRLTSPPAPTEAAAALATRLHTALTTSRLTLRAHPFSCAPLPYTRMPPDLRADFASATLTVMKGDLNYRRLVEDRHWPPTTPFAAATAYFPGPVAALRTLKSDVVTGLPADVVSDLDARGGTWRTSGAYGLVQVRG
jgi:hypothetical protein